MQSESHKHTCLDWQISRIRTFLPLISQVMCGAGRPRVVLHSAKSFSPIANGVRLRNLIEGGPVCGTVKWEREIEREREGEQQWVSGELSWQLLRTEHAHQFIGTGFGEYGRVRGDLAVELAGQIEVHILQRHLRLVRVFPLWSRDIFKSI